MFYVAYLMNKEKYKEEKKKKVYENFYLKDKGVTDEKINQ